MQIKIYADVLFFINFGMDYLLLFFTARILQKKRAHIRMIFAAALGAIYATLAFFTSAHLAVSLGVKMAISALMVLISFGWQKSRVFCKNLCTFYLISLICGGIGFMLAAFTGLGSRLGAVCSGGVWYINIPVYRLLFTMLLVYPLMRFVFTIAKRLSGKADCICRICLFCNGKEQFCTALYDTGNFLEDNKGQGIILAEWQAVAKFFPVAESFLDAPIKYPEQFTLINCFGIGGKEILPAFSAQIWFSDRKYAVTRLVAVTQNSFDSEKSYQIILPNDLEGAKHNDGDFIKKSDYFGKVSISVFKNFFLRERRQRRGILHQRRRSPSGTAYTGRGGDAAQGLEHGKL